MKRATSPLNAINVLIALALWLLVAVCFAPLVANGAERCTWCDPQTSECWAVTVNTRAPGDGGIPWAWFTIDADPRRVFTRPERELRGCRP